MIINCTPYSIVVYRSKNSDLTYDRISMCVCVYVFTLPPTPVSSRSLSGDSVKYQIADYENRMPVDSKAAPYLKFNLDSAQISSEYDMCCPLFQSLSSSSRSRSATPDSDSNSPPMSWSQTEIAVPTTPLSKWVDNFIFLLIARSHIYICVLLYYFDFPAR